MAANYKIRSILPSAPLLAEDDDYAMASQPVGTARAERPLLARGRPTPADMKDDVDQSVRTVERAVENLAALTENCDYFKTMADDLRQGLEAEKAGCKTARRQLGELEHVARGERERVARAEEHANDCDLAIKTLQRELDTVRAQTERLVDTVAGLIPADKAPDLREAFNRLVA